MICGRNQSRSDPTPTYPAPAGFAYHPPGHHAHDTPPFPTDRQSVGVARRRGHAAGVRAIRLLAPGDFATYHPFVGLGWRNPWPRRAAGWAIRHGDVRIRDLLDLHQPARLR